MVAPAGDDRSKLRRHDEAIIICHYANCRLALHRRTPFFGRFGPSRLQSPRDA